MRRAFMGLQLQCVVALGSLAGLAGTRADASALEEGSSRCADLVTADLSGVPDAPGSVVSSTVKGGDGVIPDHCEVEGYVWRNVRFKVQFPLRGWNQKMVMSGPGGTGGQFQKDGKAPPQLNFILNSSRETVPNYSGAADSPLARGYAFVMHDTGHYSELTGVLWARDNEIALVDFGIRAGHASNLIAREVLKVFYGRHPDHAYYVGCSGGGREAMMLAQRFPWDFSGIVSVCPNAVYSEAMILGLWAEHHLRELAKMGFGNAKLQILHDAVISQCDALDGRKDGLLDDPRMCDVDLERALCKDESTSTCLTQTEAKLIDKIYQGPLDSEGNRLMPLSVIMPGSELFWGPLPPQEDSYMSRLFRDLAFSPAADLGWRADIAHVEQYLKRMGTMDSIVQATNPDLRQFRRAGGKLMIVQGWSDPSGNQLRSIDYYKTVERVMGGRKHTEDFFRLFMIPGMGHCRNGDGAWMIDTLGSIDRWVANHEVPEELLAHHPYPDGSPRFTRRTKSYASKKIHYRASHEAH